MTRFENDAIEIEAGNEIEVLKRRKAELEELVLCQDLVQIKMMVFMP